MALNEVTDLPNDENLEDAALSKLDASEMLVLKPEAPLQHEVQDHSEEDSEGEEDYEVEWETESLYEDALDGIGEGGLEDATDKCTPEEAKQYRERLRAIGVHKFVQETISAGVITAKKLCTAFGIKPPAFLEGSPDGAYYQLLGLGIKRELEKRIKLPDYNTIDDAVELLKNSKNIVVLTGAGISTSLGIPDFRSKDIGLYAKLAGLGLNDPQEVFDIELFRQDPSIFFSVAKDILPATMKFTPTHAFIRLLQDKDKLLTNFTQNIDNIEGHAGILPEKTIHCHGSFATATCQRCGKSVPGEAIFEDIRNDTIPRCKKCPTPPPNGTGMKRKRSSNGRPKKRQDYEDSTDDDEEDDIAEAGIMKPDITFFGEGLSDEFHERLVNHDKERVDLVIVMGTSLKVAPVGEVPGFLPAHVPQIYISRDPCHHVNFDVDLLGDCDVVVNELCRRAGWELKHEMLPTEQAVEVELHEGYDSRWSVRVKRA